MLNSLRRLALLGLGATVLAACTDESQQPTDEQKSPSIAVQPSSPRTMSFTIPGCASPAEALDSLNKLTPQLFKGGANGRRGRVVNLINDMSRAQSSADAELAQAKADTLINTVLEDYYSGSLLSQNSDLAGTQQRVVSFITYIYCFNDLSPLPDFDYIFGGYSRFIRNETPTTIIVDDPNLTLAAVKINQGQVPTTKDGQPFYGTLISVVRTTTDVLPTDLDWYGLGTNGAPGYKKNAFRFTSDPEVTFQDPSNPGIPAGVLTGICVDYDDTIVGAGDLRVAHGVPTGYVSLPGSGNVVFGNIEILAPTDGSALGIDCDPAPIVASSALGRAAQYFARLMLPAELLAGTGKTTYSGSTSNFSPFAAVDIKLNSTSTGPTGTQYIPLNAASITAPVSVTVKTRNSKTGVTGVPVTFLASGPSGSSFAPTPVTTDATGTAASTWTLVGGTNTGTGTPSKSPLIFSPAAASFSAEVVQETTLSQPNPATLPNGVQGTAYSQTFTATGGVGSYAFAPKAGSTLPTNFTLTPAGVLGASAPVAGSYTFTVTVTSGSQTAERSYTLVVNLPAVSVTTTTLPTGFVGVPYSATLAAQGGAGAGTYSWLLSGLPAGGLSGSTAGAITGTPTGVGTIAFTATVTSTSGALSVTSTPPAPLSITVTTPTLALAFQPSPTRSQCYAINRTFGSTVATNVPRVRATTVVNGTVVGVQNVSIALEAVLNNGSKVAVSGEPIFTDTQGFASLAPVSINKSGTYTITARAGSVTTSSGRFTVSPSCP